MSVQTVLMVAGVVCLVGCVVCLGLAVFVYKRDNIKAVRDDVMGVARYSEDSPRQASGLARHGSRWDGKVKREKSPTRSRRKGSINSRGDASTASGADDVTMPSSNEATTDAATAPSAGFAAADSATAPSSVTAAADDATMPSSVAAAADSATMPSTSMAAADSVTMPSGSSTDDATVPSSSSADDATIPKSALSSADDATMAASVAFSAETQRSAARGVPDQKAQVLKPPFGEAPPEEDAEGPGSIRFRITYSDISMGSESVIEG